MENGSAHLALHLSIVKHFVRHINALNDRLTLSFENANINNYISSNYGNSFGDFKEKTESVVI